MKLNTSVMSGHRLAVSPSPRPSPQGRGGILGRLTGIPRCQWSDERWQKRQRTGALQDAARGSAVASTRGSVLECAGRAQRRRRFGARLVVPYPQSERGIYAASRWTARRTREIPGVTRVGALKRRERRAPAAGRGLQPASTSKSPLTHNTTGLAGGRPLKRRERRVPGQSQAQPHAGHPRFMGRAGVRADAYFPELLFFSITL
jgi:hypothetical protein